MLGERWRAVESSEAVRPRVGGRRARPLNAVLLFLALTGCASLGGRSHDYILGITCVVVDDTGRPIEGADVLLQLSRVAYQAITPVSDDRKTTSDSGGVVFMYITHELSTPYTLTARRTGYQEATVSGVAASGPSGVHHRIALARAPSEGR